MKWRPARSMPTMSKISCTENNDNSPAVPYSTTPGRRHATSHPCSPPWRPTRAATSRACIVQPHHDRHKPAAVSSCICMVAVRASTNCPPRRSKGAVWYGHLVRSAAPALSSSGGIITRRSSRWIKRASWGRRRRTERTDGRHALEISPYPRGTIDDARPARPAPRSGRETVPFMRAQPLRCPLLAPAPLAPCVHLWPDRRLRQPAGLAR